MPKLAIPPFTHEDDTSHPVLGDTLGPYSHAVLGEAGGLTQFGLHLEVLPPARAHHTGTGTKRRTSWSTCSQARSY